MIPNKNIKQNTDEHKLMGIFNQYPHDYISTITLREYGILTPSSIISSLKRKGAIFTKKTGEAISASGKVHKGVAFFRFEGWCHV